MAQEIAPNLENKLYDDVCNIIEQARYRVAVYVNSEASMINWNVGKRIKEDVLLKKTGRLWRTDSQTFSPKIESQIWKRVEFSKTPTLCTRSVHFQ